MQKIDKADVLKKILSRRRFMIDYLQQVITDKCSFYNKYGTKRNVVKGRYYV